MVRFRLQRVTDFQFAPVDHGYWSMGILYGGISKKNYFLTLKRTLV